MQNDVLIKKKKLLQQISSSEYRDLLGYIRKIYLADFDLKILMARKFSNLFFALLPLAKEEYGGKVDYLYKELVCKRKDNNEKTAEPVIISNRALDMLKEDIQAGKYKRILLADDIIIHGRTLTMIHDLLKSWLKGVDCEIKVYAYAENKDGILEDNTFLQERDVHLKCNTAQWRSISNEIVNIFYLLGPPYTSYVPNAIIRMESELGEAITRAVNNPKSGFTCREKIEKTSGLAKCYVYVDKSQDSHKIELSRNIRIYKYPDLGQYIFVPMVMLRPIEKVNLQNLMEDDKQEGGLSEWMDKTYWQKLSELSGKTIFYQTAVYMISAFWGWQFVEENLNRSMHDMQYDIREEKINFGGRIFNSELICTLDKEGVSKILSDINADYKEQPELRGVFADSAYNSKTFGADFKDFKDLSEAFNNNLKLFEKNGYADASEYAREIIDRYLYCNGELDEKRCVERFKSQDENNNLDESRRLIGYPLEKIKKELGEKMPKWVEMVLAAIDMGKGSIVPKVLNYKEKVYFLSVIHAGEQNYKYFEETYFPFLYGLYQLESEAAKTAANEEERQKKCSDWKNKFLELYGIYWTNENYFFLKEDIGKIKEMNMTEKFQEVLNKNVWGYFDEPMLNKAIEITKNIITAEELDVKRIQNN